MVPVADSVKFAVAAPLEQEPWDAAPAVTEPVGGSVPPVAQPAPSVLLELEKSSLVSTNSFVLFPVEVSNDKSYFHKSPVEFSRK